MSAVSSCKRALCGAAALAGIYPVYVPGWTRSVSNQSRTHRSATVEVIDFLITLEAKTARDGEAEAKAFMTKVFNPPLWISPQVELWMC